MERAAQGVHEWDRLACTAATLQLRPQLARLIAAVRLPGEAARAAKARIEEESRAHEGRARLLSAELPRILRALAEAGVRAMPFKGPMLAHFTGATGAAREMNDLDVIVEERSLQVAMHAVTALGYVPLLSDRALRSPWFARVTNELPCGGPAVPCMLELHWRMAPPWFRAPIEVPRVFDGASPVSVDGETFEWPAAEALLLMHVADAMKTGTGLRWAGDLAAILRADPNLDWRIAAQEAADHGGCGSLQVALAVLEDLSCVATQVLDLPAATVSLPRGARNLAARARDSQRLRAAIQALHQRIAQDRELGGAAHHFAWAVCVADSPARAAAAVARHLAGPSVADLEAMPSAGLGDGALRARAWARRLGAAR